MARCYHSRVQLFELLELQHNHLYASDNQGNEKFNLMMFINKLSAIKVGLLPWQVLLEATPLMLSSVDRDLTTCLALWAMKGSQISNSANNTLPARTDRRRRATGEREGMGRTSQSRFQLGVPHRYQQPVDIRPRPIRTLLRLEATATQQQHQDPHCLHHLIVWWTFCWTRTKVFGKRSRTTEGVLNPAGHNDRSIYVW